MRENSLISQQSLWNQVIVWDGTLGVDFVVGMAQSCHRQDVAPRIFLLVSSSGGGLPGRPGLERVAGRSLFLVKISSTPSATRIQLVEMVKFTVILATVSTVADPS